MENEIIIDKFKYEEPWEEFSRNILKMVIPKLKTLGYKLHISEEYLNIDVTEFAIAHKNVDLLPQTAKDVFLF